MRQRRESGRWDRLATYNAEVARGIVHTDEWKRAMAKQQEMFDIENGQHPRAEAS